MLYSNFPGYLRRSYAPAGAQTKVGPLRTHSLSRLSNPLTKITRYYRQIDGWTDRQKNKQTQLTTISIPSGRLRGLTLSRLKISQQPHDAMRPVLANLSCIAIQLNPIIVTDTILTKDSVKFVSIK